ncbi:MAG: glycosyltransferase family 2 protein [Spirochaetes bacterium]|nr:glycosyltransferase family 2 protein [Spirochaetota bacterium]
MKKEKVIAVIPAYNEQGKIGKVVQKVKRQKKWVQLICVVDDHSTDNTYTEAKTAGAFVIRQTRNMGVGAAIRTGIQYGRKNGYTIGVVLSGDDQHDPEELPLVLGPVIKDGYDLIQGSRYIKGGHTVNQGLFRKVTTRIYPILFFLLTGVTCTDVTNGLRAFKLDPLFRDKMINLDQGWLNRYELEVYLLYRIYTQKKYKKKEVPITIKYHPKEIGSTKMSPLIDWWRIFRPMIFLKFGLKK